MIMLTDNNMISILPMMSRLRVRLCSCITLEATHVYWPASLGFTPSIVRCVPSLLMEIPCTELFKG